MDVFDGIVVAVITERFFDQCTESFFLISSGEWRNTSKKQIGQTVSEILCIF